MIDFIILDIGLVAPMVGSTADSDSEIGARMGVCFTFTGRLFSKASLHSRTELLTQVSVV